MVGLGNSQDKPNSMGLNLFSLVKRYKMRGDMAGLGNSQDKPNNIGLNLL